MAADGMHNRYDTAYLFGAVCPARGVGAGMITPAANTERMNLHLEEISTQVETGAQAIKRHQEPIQGRH